MNTALGWKSGPLGDKSMLLSMADFYRAISDLIPVDLISSKAWAQICRTASFLPVLPSGGFECHLTDDQDQADFWVVLSKDDGERLPFAREGFSEGLASHLRSLPFWQRIFHFYEHWMGPTSAEYQHIQSLGFEFDVGRRTKELLIPSVFLSPHFSTTSSEGNLPTGVDLDNASDFISEFVFSISGARLSSNMRLKVTTILRSLPAGALVPFLGLMSSREPIALRFEISSLERGEIGQILEKINWPGSTTRLMNVIDTFNQFNGRLRIAIDFDEVVYSRIGLIYEFDKGKRGQASATGFLEILMEQALCTHEQMRGVLSWSGSSYDRFDPVAWPGNLDHEISPLGLIASNVLTRSINHIKINYIPGMRLNAKAYLSYNVVWTGSHETARFKALVDRNPV